MKQPPANTTKEAFIDAYRKAILASPLYAGREWIGDPARLSAYLEKVRITISTARAPWHHIDPCVNAAWLAIGGKGTPTRTALRILL